MKTEHSPHDPQRKRPRQRLALVLAAGAACLTALYAAQTLRRNAPPQTPTADVSHTAHPAVSAAFIQKPSTEPLPNALFQDGDGKPVTLESFRGRVVLLNLWATWCVPCRKEMPALDALQAALGSQDFEVVALAIDRTGAAGAKKFLDGIGVQKLKLYSDPTARLANEFKAVGLPTTILIGRDGREVGRLLGPAEWAADDAKALIKSVIAAR